MRIIPNILHIRRGCIFIWPWTIATAKWVLEMYRRYPENCRDTHEWFNSYRFGCLVFSRRKRGRASARFVTEAQLEWEAIAEALAAGGALMLNDRQEVAYVSGDNGMYKRRRMPRYDVAARYAEVADVVIEYLNGGVRKVTWRGK